MTARHDLIPPLRRAPRWIAEPWSAAQAGQGLTIALVAGVLRQAAGLAWLDSALTHAAYGRWSILAAAPRWTLTARDGRIERTAGDHVDVTYGDPIAAIAAAVEAEQRLSGLADGLPAGAPPELPFCGGAIGYLGFELSRWIERLPATTADDVGAPDLAVGWYDAALVWDHGNGRGWLAGREDAVATLRTQLALPLPEQSCAAPPAEAPQLCANFTRRDYLAAVERARRYIEAGDIYQVNLSQRFSVPVTEDGFALYHRLRDVSPAPFAAYLALGGIEVLSSSPERLLLADRGILETRPIKGTRPRAEDPAADARLASELLGSEKDRAEHVMIVDLERNDLGRIGAVGSVRVPELMALESFAQVHHLTSTVRAVRRPGVGIEALLRAVFPGGSISGAPKIRALEIIDELEPTRRGVYTGAIGYISAHGRIDLNIAIRTLTLTDGVAHMQVGGAIVHDSIAADEYRETLDKARGMARALGVRLPDEVGAPSADAAPIRYAVDAAG